MSEHESAKAQAKEKMLEAIFGYAAACHVEDILKDNPLEEDAPAFSPSPEFDRKMQKLIARHDRKEKLQNMRKKTVRFLPKAAIFLLVLLGSFTILVASVQALRVKALNIILNIREQYTSIQTTEENDGQTEQTDDGLIPPDWSGYVPNYIPPGFKVTKTEKRNMLEAIHYSNEQGQTIRFTKYLSKNTDLRIDTENATVQNISIHNCNALLTEKQGLVSIVWKEDFLFSLIGEADKAELIKMAESISKKS